MSLSNPSFGSQNCANSNFVQPKKKSLSCAVHRPREFQADTRVYAKVVQIGVDKARRLIQSASKETAGHLVTALGALFLNEDHQDRDGYIAADAFDWVVRLHAVFIHSKYIILLHRSMYLYPILWFVCLSLA